MNFLLASDTFSCAFISLADFRNCLLDDVKLGCNAISWSRVDE